MFCFPHECDALLLESQIVSGVLGNEPGAPARFCADFADRGPAVLGNDLFQDVCVFDAEWLSLLIRDICFFTPCTET